MKTESIYTNIDLCKKDLMIARETFGSTQTTIHQYDQMQKALSMMYLYCPDEIKDFVLLTLEESNRRRLYYELQVWPQTERC